jgi:hypothetical protein
MRREGQRPSTDHSDQNVGGASNGTLRADGAAQELELLFRSRYPLVVVDTLREDRLRDLSSRTAKVSEGFSGAELEQAIVAALYTAFSEDREIDTDTLRAEIDRAVPLSVTMAEGIAAPREWARERTVPAS